MLSAARLGGVLEDGRRSGVSFLQVVDAVCYDETPVAARSAPSQKAPKNNPRLIAQADGGAIAAHIEAAMLPLTTGAEPRKLFQSILEWAFLMSAQHRAGLRRYMTTMGSTVSHIQSVDSTSGVCTAKALTEAGGATLSESKAESATRIISSDRAGGNLFAERLLAAERPNVWQRLFSV